jgi:RHS repeat-associated protein
MRVEGTPNCAIHAWILTMAIGATAVWAEPLLQMHTPALTTYLPSGSTAVQGVRPLCIQRGVNADGTMRSSSSQSWSLAANSLELGGAEAWNRNLNLGSMNLAAGTYAPTDADIALPSNGPIWVVARSYNGRQETSGAAHQDSNGYQGKNWFQMSQPCIVLFAGATTDLDVLYIVYGADRFIELQRSGVGTNYFKARNGAAGVAEFVAGTGGQPDTYTYTDQLGNTAVFFGSTNAGAAAWQLWKISDEAGNTAFIGDATTGTTAISSGYDGSGRVLLAYDAASGGGRRYTYTYTTIDSVSRLTQVKAETKTGGSWTSSPTGVATVAQVDYAYYQTGDNSEGDNGNLKLVTTTTPLSNGSLMRNTLYRYWKGAYNASTNPGYPNTIKLVVGPEGYRKYDWAQNSALDDDTQSASTTNLKPYADTYLEYDANYRVNLVFFHGECGCGGGSGSGLHTITYDNSSSYGTYTGNGQYDNGWATRTVIKQPAYDPGASPAQYAYITQYFDEVAQPLSRVITDGDPTGTSPAPPRWVTEVTRAAWDSTDKIGGLIENLRTPESNDTYTHSSGSIAALSGAGLITVFTRNSTTGADLKGFATDRRVMKGTGGTAYFEQGFSYTTASKSVGSVSVIRPLQDELDLYKGSATGVRDSGTFDTTDASTTLHTLVTKDVIETPATISSGANGSGSSTTTARYHNTDGTLAFDKTADGIITYRAYLNGQLTALVQDADTGTLSGGGVTIPSSPTNYASWGSELHLTTTYAYDAQGRPSTTTLPDGRVTMMFYTRLKDGRMVTLSIPKFVAGSPDTVYGPVSYTVTNLAGKAEFTSTISLSTSTTALSSWVSTTSGGDPIASLSVGTITRLHTSVYSSDGHKLLESRPYSVVPGSGTGSEGTHYDTTLFGYNPLGQQWRVEEPHGTVTRTIFDALGRVTATWMGTNDNDSTSFPDGDTSGTANMVKTAVIVYDSGSANKNSLVTSRTVDADGNWAVTTDQRVTTNEYDFRGRMLLQTNPQSPHSLNKYDNLNRIVASALYSSTGSITVGTTDPAGSATNDKANRVGLSETLYDEQGRVWKTVQHEITSASGASADSIDNQSWYDPNGRLMKEKGQRGHGKYRYDRIGRRTHSFTLATDDDSQYSHASASTAVYNSTDGKTSVAGDIVLEEDQTTFDSSTGKVLMRATIRRFHDDLANGNTGELDTNADADAGTYTAANVKGRPQFAVMYYDTLSRLTDTAIYGTNIGSTFSRPGSVASRSDTVLVTTHTYNGDGSLLEIEDAKGLKTRHAYDASARITTVVKNYVDGTPGGGTHNDQDRTIVYLYVDGLLTSMTADMPSGTDQVTTYIHGSAAGTPAAMKLTTGHLLRAIKYPDSANGGSTLASIDSDSSDVVSFAYNALGEPVYKKDQIGGVIERDVDTAGRESHTRVTTLGSGLNGAVRRISTTYTSRSQVDAVTQYDNATVGSGSIVDQVDYSYDDWGNVASFTQDPDSAIGGGGRASFAVSYTHTRASPSGGAVRVRKATMTSPGGSDLTYEYISASNCLDEAVGRVTDIKVGSTVVATYKYNGLSQVVGTDLNEPNFYWRQYSTTGVYSDLDRFDRVVKSKWTKGNGTPRQFYDLDIAYDRGSQITGTVDNIHTSAAGGTGNGRFDVSYTLDGLNRVIRAEEGNWTGSAINNGTRDERWMDGSNNSSLSQTGNWGRHRLDLNGDGVFTGGGELDDTRTHNVVNEVTGRDTDTSGTDNYTLSYDANGNLSDDGKDYTYTYDAFGRLKQVKTRGGSPVLVTEYTYNGMNHRTSWHYDVDASGTTNGSDPTYSFCYDERWRVVATFRGSDSDPKERFVFHGAGLVGSAKGSYIDDLILRNKDFNAGWDQASDGVLEERTYYMHNWRHDLSLMATSGSRIIEHVKYLSYGRPFGMPAGDNDSLGSNTGNDFTIIGNWIAGGSWDARGDINTDGAVNATDAGLIPSEILGLGVLSRSDVNNRMGYAAYQHAPDLAGTKWHVRHRVMDSDLGSWLTRDPLGNMGGPSLYAYVDTRPLTAVDAFGLIPVCYYRQLGPARETFGDTEVHEGNYGMQLANSMYELSWYLEALADVATVVVSQNAQLDAVSYTSVRHVQEPANTVTGSLSLVANIGLARIAGVSNCLPPRQTTPLRPIYPTERHLRDGWLLGRTFRLSLIQQWFVTPLPNGCTQVDIQAKVAASVNQSYSVTYGIPNTPLQITPNNPDGIYMESDTIELGPYVFCCETSNIQIMNQYCGNQNGPSATNAKH